MSNYRKISAVQLVEHFLDKVVLIDVRGADEFAVQRLAGSVNIPLEDLTAEKVSELADNDKPTICLVCLKGMRSIKAGDKIAAELTSPLLVVEDGIEALPVECLIGKGG